ncbi:hypothetical protein BDQ12DRAFT_734302 [Crucibulum laeve]|uniref:Uncharacterized protein n=1 Tax=Crucibulum laeve TaxID=68775 RepID=A0A5C3M4F1_9AGAR|nr:hypothetical protein BDQ12DRAFT_734302 [Crucibulum laeve]
MSSPLSTVPDALPVVHRPASLRSVASNSSIASGVSLTRRPRTTRTRSKTVTGGSSGRSDQPNDRDPSELPYLDTPYVQEPLPVGNSSFSSQEPLSLGPVRPPRSPHRLETDLRSTDVASSQDSELAGEATFVEVLPQPSLISGKMSKAVRKPSNLSTIKTVYKPPPSAFSRDPALTPAINMRDSISTQQSGTSSSIYPPSTSTASGPDSPPSPRSMADQHLFDASPFAPEVNDLQEYDNDDVSYRLRLLVKNNYFLPPAHSKPSPSDFAISAQNASKRPTKSAAPTFLDLFRVGKSKSKPTTPTGTAPGVDPTAPMLRTASDSITASYALRSQPRSSSQVPRLLSPHTPGANPRGRVVVVREKMHDIAVAAKQAEQELKTRGVHPEGSQKGKQQVFDDVIDPTDAVDLPPPSASYPFAVQASALHGLTVQDSVGAAILADRLPPPKSPNASSSYDPEDDWRKALLHEAVYHSLDHSPNVSTFSHILGASTPPPRFSGSTSRGDKSSRIASPSSKLHIKAQLEKRILDAPTLEALDTSPPSHARRKSSQSHASTSRVQPNGELGSPASFLTQEESSRPSSYLPLRVDTPTGPMTPLTPAPRRTFVNPLFSLSQTSLPTANPSQDAARPLSTMTLHTLRRAASTPMLSDAYDNTSLHNVMLAPPPMPALTNYSGESSSHIADSFETSREHPSDGLAMSISQYSDDDDDDDEYVDPDPARGSLALSAVNGRPSLSDYSQSSLSPTGSAFQDAYGEDYNSRSSSINGLRISMDQQTGARDSPAPRYSAMSPPPRVSSSLAHIALMPPPRSSSMRYITQQQQQNSSSSISGQGNSSITNEEEETVHIIAPPPSTPPLPISERRGNNNAPLSLLIPSSTVPVAIHSAPGPSSPTSFFDTIQTHPNAMDDLDSSSDESDDDMVTEATSTRGRSVYVDHRARAMSNVTSVSPRPPIMRLGNHSTPYVSRSPISDSLRPKIDLEAMKPIGHTPSRPTFFADRKGDQAGQPSSAFDFYKYTQEHPPVVAGPSDGKRRPATAGHVAEWQTNQRAQDSLRKLDGMLIQHMEAEKDTIKRIATTMKQTHPKADPFR